MKVSFVLLAHESPEALRLLIETLLATGSDVYVHHDGKNGSALKSAVEEWNLSRFQGRLFCAEQVKVEWGEWSIVQATLNCLKLARDVGYNADYFMLISGSCMPVQPIRMLENFLEEYAGFDFIEVVNASENQWVTDGIQWERWELFHFVNWRSTPKLFTRLLEWQKKLKIKRRLPLQHVPYMGSQWWCLRSATIDNILGLLDRNPGLVKFYKRTWVPDELFFQTMVGNIVPRNETSAEILTRYKFNSCGVPRVYYEDDLSELLGETAFFARKISSRAYGLRKALAKVAEMSIDEFSSLIADTEAPYFSALYEKIILAQKEKNLRWYREGLSQWNEYDYVKAVPNQMVVVLSPLKELRQRAIDLFRQERAGVIYNDIFGGADLEFCADNKPVSGYRTTSSARAWYKWHHFLGELIFHAEDKALIFSIGMDAAHYLRVLRWSFNLTILVIEPEVISWQTAKAALQAKWPPSADDKALLGGLKGLRSLHAEILNGQSDLNDGKKLLEKWNNYINILEEDSHCAIYKAKHNNLEGIVSKISASLRGEVPTVLPMSLSANNMKPSF